MKRIRKGKSACIYKCMYINIVAISSYPSDMYVTMATGMNVWITFNEALRSRKLSLSAEVHLCNLANLWRLASRKIHGTGLRAIPGPNPVKTLPFLYTTKKAGHFDQFPYVPFPQFHVSWHRCTLHPDRTQLPSYPLTRSMMQWFPKLLCCTCQGPQETRLWRSSVIEGQWFHPETFFHYVKDLKSKENDEQTPVVSLYQPKLTCAAGYCRITWLGFSLWTDHLHSEESQMNCSSSGLGDFSKYILQIVQKQKSTGGLIKISVFGEQTDMARSVWCM